MRVECAQELASCMGDYVEISNIDKDGCSILSILWFWGNIQFLYIAKINTLENVTKQSISLQRKLSMIFTNKVG